MKTTCCHGGGRTRAKRAVLIPEISRAIHHTVDELAAMLEDLGNHLSYRREFRRFILLVPIVRLLLRTMSTFRFTGSRFTQRNPSSLSPENYVFECTLRSLELANDRPRLHTYQTGHDTRSVWSNDMKDHGGSHPMANLRPTLPSTSRSSTPLHTVR